MPGLLIFHRRQQQLTGCNASQIPECPPYLGILVLKIARQDLQGHRNFRAAIGSVERDE
jgi:hypothetical protein